MAVPYLTADEVRDAVDFLGDDAKYPDGLIAGYVSEFEGKLEQYRGVAFTPRVTVEPIPVRSGARSVTLAWPKVRGINLVTVDGTALDSSGYRTETGAVVSTVGFTPTGSWPSALVVVTYEHGYDIPVAGDPIGAQVIAATIEYVKAVAQARPQRSGREVIATGGDGNWVRYSAPDANRGRPTGYVAVDELMNGLPDHRVPVFTC